MENNAVEFQIPLKSLNFFYNLKRKEKQNRSWKELKSTVSRRQGCLNNIIT
jgi:hypothetical protein